MLLFDNKIELLNTIMIITIIVFLLVFFITNYFKSIENFNQFNQYGYVACPPQFVKQGTTDNMYYNKGNVGIGTDNPQAKLHINGALYLTSNPSNPGNGASASFWNQAGIGPTISGANFSVQTNGTTESMRILSNGDVGIGNSNPGHRLDVIDDGTYIAAFRHTNLSQGIGIQYNGLTAMGAMDANTSQDIIIKSKKNGKVIFNTNDSDRGAFDGSGNLNVEGDINIASGSKFKINGVDLNYSHLAGTPLLYNNNQTIQTIYKPYKYNRQIARRSTNNWIFIDDNLDDGFVIKIKPIYNTSGILLNLIMHCSANLISWADGRWWGARLYRKIGNGAWEYVDGASGNSSIGDQWGVWFCENDINLHYITNVSATYMDKPQTTYDVYYTIKIQNPVGSENRAGEEFYLNTSQISKGNNTIPISSWTAQEIYNPT